MEFAILALPFFVLLLGTMEVGYDFFVQAALDQAVQTASRSVQVGASQRGASQTMSQFVAQSVCPALGKLLDCGRLYVWVSSVPSGVGQNYYTFINANPPNLNTMTGQNNVVCTGTAGQLMIVRAYYLSPTIIGMLVPSFTIKSPVNSTALVHASFAQSGFVNENFSGGQSGC